MAALEFGLLAPVLILLLLGGADLVATIRAQLRLDAAAVQLGQIASQCSAFSRGDFARLLAQGRRLIGDVGQVEGTAPAVGIVITAVNSVDGENLVAWQRRDGLPITASSFGSRRGSPATLSDGRSVALNPFLVPSTQTLIVTEVFLQRRAWLLSPTLLGGSGEAITRGMTLFLTRVPDAAAVALEPRDEDAPLCLV